MGTCLCLCERTSICGTGYGHTYYVKGGSSTSDKSIVHTMYMKNASKNAKHEHIRATRTPNLSALSNVVVQVFEHSHGWLFSCIPTATALLGMSQFACLPPSHILTLLLLPTQTLSLRSLELSPSDVSLFSDLQNGLKGISVALKELNKRMMGDDESD